MANPIEIENTLTGTTGWKLAKPVPFSERDAITYRTAAIEGYASLTSVNIGEKIAFYVSTTAPSFRMDIYRMGWYTGDGGRLVFSVGSVTGVNQPTPAQLDDPVNGLASCSWIPSYELTIPTSWISGIYLAKLTANDTNQYESYVIFVVRDDRRPSDYLMQSSVTTYQAYNGWGARSIYGYNCAPILGNGDTAKVSFNRPYFAGHRGSKTCVGTTPYATGSGHFFAHFPSDTIIENVTYETPWPGWEYNMVRWLEKNGHDVTYCTNIDVHRDADLLFSHRAFLSVGHDEYWSREMRFHVELARDHGVDVFFFGGNSVFDQVRLESDFLGNPHRTLVCFKDHPGDPRDAVAQRIKTGNAIDDDLFPYPNTAGEFNVSTWPETSLTGSTLANITWEGPEHLQIGFNDPNLNISTSDWVLAGSGALARQTLQWMAGYETDADLGSSDANYAPPNRRVLASTTTGTAAGKGKVIAYSVDGGTTVFSAGTIQWAWGLDDFVIDGIVDARVPPAANAIVQRMTANLLARAKRTTGAEAYFFQTDGHGNIQQLGSSAGWRTRWRIIPGKFSAGDRDILLYDPTTGEAFFNTIANDGTLTPTGTGLTGWRKSWRIIPGHFSTNSFTDLLLYDPVRGEAGFYSTAGNGTIQEIGQLQTGWRQTWQIIPGHFTSSPFTDLLFYDPAHGYGAFYQTDGTGGIQQISEIQDWRRTWRTIIPGRFSQTSTGFDDLLFYDPLSSIAKGAFFNTTGTGGISQFGESSDTSPWRHTWRIIPGHFSTSGLTDLLFYDPVAGEGWFFSSDQSGGLIQIGSSQQTGWRRSWEIVPCGTGTGAFTDLLFYDAFATAP